MVLALCFLLGVCGMEYVCGGEYEATGEWGGVYLVLCVSLSLGCHLFCLRATASRVWGKNQTAPKTVSGTGACERGVYGFHRLSEA